LRVPTTTATAAAAADCIRRSVSAGIAWGSTSSSGAVFVM
jgi:hypothetical protein